MKPLDIPARPGYNMGMDNLRPLLSPSMPRRFFVTLSRPENQENIGMVARAMANCGFHDLRMIGIEEPGERAYKTAIHSHGILEKARFFPDTEAAVGDLDLVFAATGKIRKNFSVLSFSDAVEKMSHCDPYTRIGILFGNERTGLTSTELQSSNFRFWIPQASRQPSYNLAGAVLLTLFALAARVERPRMMPLDPLPLSREEQEECIRRIIEGLTEREFIHEANRRHMTERIHDLLGRLAITARDRKLLLALFNKGTVAESGSKDHVSE